MELTTKYMNENKIRTFGELSDKDFSRIASLEETKYVNDRMKRSGNDYSYATHGSKNHRAYYNSLLRFVKMNAKNLGSEKDFLLTKTIAEKLKKIIPNDNWKTQKYSIYKENNKRTIEILTFEDRKYNLKYELDYFLNEKPEVFETQLIVNESIIETKPFTENNMYLETKIIVRAFTDLHEKIYSLKEVREKEIKKVQLYVYFATTENKNYFNPVTDDKYSLKIEFIGSVIDESKINNYKGEKFLLNNAKNLTVKSTGIDVDVTAFNFKKQPLRGITEKIKTNNKILLLKNYDERLKSQHFFEFRINGALTDFAKQDKITANQITNILKKTLGTDNIGTLMECQEGADYGAEFDVFDNFSYYED